MEYAILYTIAGYLAGSIVFARLYSQLFHETSMIQDSKDKNPGAANAFVYGGFKAGLFTILGDFFKGFFPVFLYMRTVAQPDNPWILLVAMAPVAGHIWPLFYRFHGGKGIATTFGVYAAFFFAGLAWQPLAVLIVLFLIFRFVIVIRPNLYLTAVVYVLLPVSCLWLKAPGFVPLACTLISAIVLMRLIFSKEPHPALEVPLWKH